MWKRSHWKRRVNFAEKYTSIQNHWNNMWSKFISVPLHYIALNANSSLAPNMRWIDMFVRFIRNIKIMSVHNVINILRNNPIWNSTCLFILELNHFFANKKVAKQPLPPNSVFNVITLNCIILTKQIYQLYKKSIWIDCWMNWWIIKTRMTMQDCLH